MDERERRERMDAYDKQMHDLVDRYGVAIQGVGAGDDEPQFAYTVGLAARWQPEFIMFGLPMPVAQRLLNDIAKTVLDGTRAFAHGDTVWDLVRDYPVRLLTVTDTTTHLTLANRFYANPITHRPIAALQIVFPDAKGRWPWQPGSGVANMPLLGPVPGEEQGTEVHLPVDNDDAGDDAGDTTDGG